MTSSASLRGHMTSEARVSFFFFFFYDSAEASSSPPAPLLCLLVVVCAYDKSSHYLSKKNKKKTSSIPSFSCCTFSSGTPETRGRFNKQEAANRGLNNAVFGESSGRVCFAFFTIFFFTEQSKVKIWKRLRCRNFK